MPYKEERHISPVNLAFVDLGCQTPMSVEAKIPTYISRSRSTHFVAEAVHLHGSVPSGTQMMPGTDPD